ANFVGRSVVSAITHTPASGPLGPRTTPPRSLSPTVTAAPCCAWASGAKTASARPIAAALAQSLDLIVMTVFLRIVCSFIFVCNAPATAPGAVWTTPGGDLPTRLLGERIRTDLEVHHHRLAALAAFDQPGCAIAAGRP